MAELTIDQAFQQGIEAHKVGQVQEADRLYTAILKAQPKHPDANHNMGVLAVGVGKVQEALPFFKTALEANPAKAQFWLSYIDTLIKLGKLADGRAVLDQARSKGAKGDGFDKLEQRLHEAGQEPLLAKQIASEPQPKQPNILDSLTLDQAISLAKKKAKAGSTEEAKRVYQDILTKFPKNKRASDGMKRLAGKTVGEASKVQDPTQDQLQSLVNLYSQGQLQLALKQAETLVQQFPQSAILLNIQGAVLKGLGQFDASVEAYHKALAIKPDYAEAYYNMGNALKEQGKLEEAIEAYNKALAIKPDYAEAYYNMGNALQEQGKLEEAIEAYNKALAINPDNAEAYYNMGKALQEQGKLEEAIEAYNKALAINPDNAEAYNNMGVALQEQGKLEEAIEAYNKALAINPDNAEAYNNMGVALEEQGKLEEAIEAYNKALVIKPDYAEAYNNMGNALKDQGKLEEAIEAYNKALAIKPDYAKAYYNMGNALKEQGKLEEAIEAYNKALAIKPDYAKAYYNMGNALKEQGKLEEAIEAYNKALAIKPDYAEAYYNMGNALQEQGKLEEAIEACNKALAINPDNAEAYNNMGVALQEQGKLEEAIEAYNKALAINPDNAEAYNNMGVALQEQGKLEEAIEAYNKALVIKPDYAEAYNNMGNALKDQGKLEEAIEAYNKALAIKPDIAEAMENSQSLAVQLLPIITNYGYDFDSSEAQVNPEIVLRPKYQIQNAIKAYLEGDFIQADSHINNFKACDQNLLGRLKPKNKVFCNAYSSFIGRLLEATWDEEHASENKVYHLGESHSLSYAHRNITIDGSDFRIAPRITFGAKAFHFSRTKEDSFKAITKAHFISLPKNSKVFLSYGEIDCRPNEGFISAARKRDKPLEELIDQTTVGYVQWFLEQNADQRHHLYFINVPAPVYDEKLSSDLNSEVLRTVALFNAALKKCSLEHGFDTVNVFKFTAGSEGFSNGLFHVDGHHLGAKALEEIQRQLC